MHLHCRFYIPQEQPEKAPVGLQLASFLSRNKEIALELKYAHVLFHTIDGKYCTSRVSFAGYLFYFRFALIEKSV